MSYGSDFVYLNTERDRIWKHFFGAMNGRAKPKSWLKK